MARSTKKISLSELAINVSSLIGGGTIGAQTTNVLEKLPFMSGREKLAPVVTAGLGAFGAYMTRGKVQFATYGVIAVSGAEVLENLIMSAKSDSAVQGFIKKARKNQLNMGFVPQAQPGGSMTVFSNNGIPAR